MIGAETYHALESSSMVEEEVKDSEISAIQKKMDPRYKAISLLNMGLSRKEVCDALKIKLHQLEYYINLASKDKLDVLPIQPVFGQAWYNELSIYLSCPLRRHTSLNDIRKHLCRELDQPQDKISLKKLAE